MKMKNLKNENCEIQGVGWDVLIHVEIGAPIKSPPR
jgi:hypothetical protein